MLVPRELDKLDLISKAPYIVMVGLVPSTYRILSNYAIFFAIAWENEKLLLLLYDFNCIFKMLWLKVLI